MRLHLSTLRDNDILIRLVVRDAGILHHANEIHALDDAAKNNMLVVQKRRGGASNEELTSVGVWARVLDESRVMKLVL